MLIDYAVKIAIKFNTFNNTVNIAIDEYHKPYTGKDNWAAPFII